jgi:ABC-type transport system substrate-binding protein
MAKPSLAWQPAQQARASSGVLVYPDVTSDLWPKTLDPAMILDTQSLQVVNLVYSGLLMLNTLNHLTPDLASGMPLVSADHRTYTFTLRPRAAFSDGTPVTAQDVVYSISRYLSKQEASPVAMTFLGHIQGAAAWNAGKAKNLAGVVALDSRTVQFRLDAPVAYLLEALASEDYVVKDGTPPGAQLATNQSLNVGTGPFMFGRPWRYRQEMYLVPNPYWYNASKLHLKEVDIPFISTFDVAYREYESGQIPMAQVPSSLLASVRNKPDFHGSPALGVDFITLNHGKDAQCKPVSCAPFNDIHFRRALVYAINREAVMHVVLRDEDLPLCGLVPRGLPGYDPSLCNLTPYDPARAKAELALAKQDFGGTLPNDGRLTLYYVTIDPKYALLYTELQTEWRVVGINIQITALPLNHWLDLAYGNYTPMLADIVTADFPDAQNFTEGLLASTSPFNAGAYDDPTFDRLVDEADVTANGPARAKLYIQAQQVAIGNVACIVLGQLTLDFEFSQDIHGVTTAFSPVIAPVPVGGDWTNVSVS